jgi:hypothetical protein
MIALLGSLLGFGTSFLPQILGFFQQKQEHKNKIELLKLQGELASLGVQDEIAKLDKQAEIAEMKAIYSYANPTKGFAAGLSASVRPVITYVFFSLFIATKVAVIMMVLESGGDWRYGINMVFDDETQALFSAVISFWFGNRSVSKFMERKK